MYESYERSQGMYLFVGVVLSALLLIAAWPVLPMAGAIAVLVILLYEFGYSAQEKAEKYAKTKLAFGCGVGFMIALPIYLYMEHLLQVQENGMNSYITEIQAIFDKCVSNISSLDFASNFKLYFTANTIIWGIFLVTAFFVAAYFFYIFEKDKSDDDSCTGGKKPKTFKEFILNMIFLPDETADVAEREPEDEATAKPKKMEQAEYTARIKHTAQKPKQEVAPNYLGVFQIFLVRPRLFLFLAANYLLFWFKVGVPAAENILLLAIYITVIALSLSGFAEWIFRKLENARHVATFTEKERLLALFENVKERAMKRSKIIDGKLKLYIVDSMSINAFSIGRHTIAVTRGLMNAMNDEELEGVIAHEMAHIINGDTQVSMLVTAASNMYIWGLLLISKACYILETLIGGTSFVKSLLTFIRSLLDLLVKYIITVFTVLVASTSRKEEYRADKGALELGYGEGLLSALYKLYDIEMSGKKKLLDKLQETHPILAFRIEAIENKLYQEEYVEGTV